MVFPMWSYPPGPAWAQKEATEVDLELALGIDISGSIDPEEARLQRQGYVQAFRDPAIARAILGGYHGRIAVTFFEWSDAWRQQTLISWTLLDSERAIADWKASRGDHPDYMTKVGLLNTAAASAKEMVLSQKINLALLEKAG